VLTAGLGVRLRPLTDERAKPAMPVAGEPLIRRIASWLASHGITELVLNLHHLPGTITSVLGDGGDLGVRVRYSWEQPRILGSGGGPKQALPILGVDRFFLINGDTLTNVDLRAMARAHADSGALVTLALVPNREFHRYGGVHLDRDGGVTRFSRRGPDSADSWHFIGAQVVDASVFDAAPPGEPSSTIGGIYDDLIRTRPGAVRGFTSDADFRDVGTAADYLRTSQALSASGVDVGLRARVDPTARITRSVLWDDVEVGAGTSLTDCIVSDGVEIPGGTEYQRSILMRRDDRLAVFPLES